MFLTLTLNPAIDSTLSVAGELRIGGVHRVVAEARTPGGKGVNVAKAIAALGGRVTAAGLLGQADAAVFGADLARIGVHSNFLPVPEPTRVNIMAVDAHGHELKLNAPGFPGLECDRHALAAYVRHAAAAADVVVISGSLPARFPPALYAEWVQLLKGMGKAVVLDAAGDALAQAVATRPNVVKPNRHELEELAGRPLPTEAELVGELVHLTDAVDTVILSDGARGAYFASRHGVIHAAPPRVAAIDTTGAGDWLLGAFCAAYFPECKLTDRVIALAVAAGSAAVEVRGTPFIPGSRIEALATHVRPRVLARAD